MKICMKQRLISYFCFFELPEFLILPLFEQRIGIEGPFGYSAVTVDPVMQMGREFALGAWTAVSGAAYPADGLARNHNISPG